MSEGIVRRHKTINIMCDKEQIIFLCSVFLIVCLVIKEDKKNLNLKSR